MTNQRPLSSVELNRRHFLAAGATGVGSLAVAGCGSDNPSGEAKGESGRSTGEVEIAFWTWTPRIERVVEQFNDAHKGKIKANLTKVTSGPNGGYAKLHSALKAGNAPDVALLEYQEVPSFLLAQGLENVREHAKKYKDRYVDWAWSECMYAGKVYAVPQSSAPMVLYYRKDLFDELGISVPRTWDEFATAAEAVHKKDPKRRICNFPVGPKSSGGWFAALAWQAGATWFTTEGETWRINMTDKASTKVAEFWQDLVTRDLVTTKEGNSSASWRDVQDGSVVAYPAASWTSNLLQSNAPKTSGDWRVAALPQWDDAASPVSGNWGGGVYGIMKGTKHPKEATEFAVWLSSNSRALDTFVSSVHSLPAVADLSKVDAIEEDDKFFSFFGGQNVYKKFQQASKQIDVNWQWTPVTILTYDSLTKGFTRTVNGKGTFVDALSMAQKDTIDAMKGRGLKVAGS